MKITVQTTVQAPMSTVWETWNNPEDIKQWNTASEDWHTTSSEVDLREGGKFTARMEAKDGSIGFDFGGTYTRVEPNKAIEYRMDDAREVSIEFVEQSDGSIHVKETFDAETENSAEMQQAGWQAILDSFGKYTEAKG